MTFFSDTKRKARGCGPGAEEPGSGDLWSGVAQRFGVELGTEGDGLPPPGQPPAPSHKAQGPEVPPEMAARKPVSQPMTKYPKHF